MTSCYADDGQAQVALWVSVNATLPLAEFTAIGVLADGLLTRLVPELILRKIAAVLLVMMGIFIWFDTIQNRKTTRRWGVRH